MTFDRSMLTLYLIADVEHCRGDVATSVETAVQSGVTMVQLRSKTGIDRETVALAEHLGVLCRRAGIPLVINDRVDVAMAVGANGVHLGVDDMPVHIARRLLGPDAIIGFSPDSDAGILSAGAQGASYLGIGPVYGTSTKGDAGAALGVEELRRRVELSPLPVVAIGGISQHHVSNVMDKGPDGIAVVSAILGAPDVGAATRALRHSVDTMVR